MSVPHCRGILFGLFISIISIEYEYGIFHSYNYFNKLDDLIITGPTKTNVMDIQIVLINPN